MRHASESDRVLVLAWILALLFLTVWTYTCHSSMPHTHTWDHKYLHFCIWFILFSTMPSTSIPVVTNGMLFSFHLLLFGKWTTSLFIYSSKGISVVSKSWGYVRCWILQLHPFKQKNTYAPSVFLSILHFIKQITSKIIMTLACLTYDWDQRRLLTSSRGRLQSFLSQWEDSPEKSGKR